MTYQVRFVECTPTYEMGFVKKDDLSYRFFRTNGGEYKVESRVAASVGVSRVRMQHWRSLVRATRVVAAIKEARKNRPH